MGMFRRNVYALNHQRPEAHQVVSYLTTRGQNASAHSVGLEKSSDHPGTAVGRCRHLPLLLPTQALLSVTLICGSFPLECTTGSQSRAMVVALSADGPRYFGQDLMSSSRWRSIIVYHLCVTSCTVNSRPSRLRSRSHLSFQVNYSDFDTRFVNSAVAYGCSSPVSVGKVLHPPPRTFPHLGSIQGTPVRAPTSLSVIPILLTAQPLLS